MTWVDFQRRKMSKSAGKRRVAVIGAGVAGMMTAYALSKRGVEVLVIDAMSGPAEMCSRANAGIIAVGHARAWAGPQALGAMLKAIAGRDPSVKVSRPLDPALWRWGIEFLANCTPHAHHRNTETLQRLS
ncbi:FAD-dependent oxidoreductase, partial [Mesorhizobium sp. M0119]|uniref:FAD-dependent oxidoreductase n=1 Tax=Mesorhizobium sp. M0119 TaxID=2956885 RepID=UPI0033362FC7